MITKINDNEVEITKTVVETRDYETLVSQRDGILAQQQAEHDAMDVRDAERAVILNEIDESLGKGIVAKEVEVIDVIK